MATAIQFLGISESRVLSALDQRQDRVTCTCNASQILGMSEDLKMIGDFQHCLPWARRLALGVPKPGGPQQRTGKEGGDGWHLRTEAPWRAERSQLGGWEGLSSQEL